MLVYRVCNEKEINTIFNEKSFKKIGNYFEINQSINTNHYVKNKKYIHFFKYFNSIFYLNVSKGKFICTYDIPNYLLEEHLGYGFYYDRFNFKNLEKVVEYAIENGDIMYEYLIKVDKVLEYIDIEDFIYNNFEDKLELIYLNENHNKELSKKLTLLK